MWKLLLALIVVALSTDALAQGRALATLGSSTTAGLAASPIDSSWVNRVNYYYKTQLGILDNTYNLGVSGTTCYNAMPTGYVPPIGRPSPDAAHNVTQALSLLSGLSTPSNGVIIVNFPTNGYDGFTIAEILTSLQTIYNAAVQTGNRCYVTTTQPRSDGNFALSATKKKLAILKDSIINRFGVDHTLNFWDGMYNPADTTILPAYSAGDNVHFNNVGHRVLFQRVRDKNIFNLSPAYGDYRSNMANGATGTWSTASIWQRYTGTAWVAATVPPNNNSGVVTIQNGHRVDMTSSTMFDQVVVAAGGQLFIYNFTVPTVFTLSDGTGNDIEVNGSLFVSINSSLTGAGTITNNAAGTFTVRNQGILAVKSTNNGTMNVSGTGNFQSTTVTNNGTFNLLDFTLNLNTNASLINNGLINLTSTATSWIATTAGTGTLTNNVAGTILKTSAASFFEVNAPVTFINHGTMKGVGEYMLLSTTINNDGTIEPGNASAAALTINAVAVSNKSPLFNMELNSTGAIAGTNYDQIRVTTSGGSTNANLTAARLQVTDNAGDAIGTTYTLFTFPSGTITGPFASVSLPPTLGNLTYTATAVTVQKTSNGKHWVGTYLYQNNFQTTSELNEWNLVENNGTGSWTLTANSSAILKMDNAAGAYAVRIFHETGGVPSRYPLDKVNGIVEFHVNALTGGNQRFFLQVQEFQSNGTYIQQQTILAPQNIPGFFTINLSSFTWNALTTQIRFIIGGENFSAQQGTIEFDYFKYTNSAQTWSSSANWSATAAGAGGAGVPTATEVVYFDNVRTANCTFDAPLTVSSILVNTGYTGVITQGTNPITINNTANFAAGHFAGGSGNITVGGTFTLSGGDFQSTTGILEFRGNTAFTSGTFTPNGGTVRYNTINAVSQTISGTGPSFYNLEFVGLGRTYNITAGTLTVQNALTCTGTLPLTLTTGLIDVKGDVTLSNTATGGGGNATLQFSGTGIQNLYAPAVAGQCVLPKVTINKSSGSLVVRNTLSVTNDWTHVAGTVDAVTNNSSVVFGGNNLTVTSSGMHFNNFSVSSNIILLGSSVNVDGNLTLAGGTLSAGNNAINLKGNWTNNAAFTSGSSGTVNFAGVTTAVGGSSATSFQNVTVSGELHAPLALPVAGNFVNNGNFAAGLGVVRFNGTTPQSIAGTSTSLFHNIEITNATAAVSVETNQNLQGVLTLANNAVFNADGTSDNAVFTLLSTDDDPVQDAAIAALPSGAQVTGKVTVQRYMSIEGANNTRIYRYIASPVLQAPASDLQAEIPITGSFIGTSACVACAQTMYAYDETVITDINGSHTADLNDGYVGFPATTNTEVLQPGVGYAIFVKGNLLASPVWDVRGAINQGNVTPVTLPVTFTSSGNMTNDGWNLVGNPYASTIDWNAASGWTKTNVDGTIYITDNGFVPLRYATWNGVTGTNGGSGYIPMGQAFWVKTSGTPTLRANENVKTPGQSTAFFRPKVNDLVRITLSNGKIQDEAVIHFREDATRGFDDQADAWKLKNVNLNLSSLTDANEKLTINSMPALLCDTEVKLAIDDVGQGNYTLDFSSLDSFSGNPTLTLKDNFLKQNISLAQQSTYAFQVTSDTASKGAARFALTIEKEPPAITIVEEDGVLKIDFDSEIQWFLNGEAIAGAASPTFTPTTSGVYSVTVSRQGCELTGAREFLITDVEHEPVPGVKVFPVPIENVLQVSVDAALHIKTATLVNAQGKTIDAIALTCSQGTTCTGTLDMNDYATGFYTILLKGDDSIISMKVIKN
ncbi:hypothetical protein [Chryseolinea soli]|uniref:T9SS C-terminal target domain-containing protein n=1 Tax=Chryseolinea soli TaxID=2321403 RepID=A0A385SX40_9BACT|nr:hypothetical protein [Chryseolinea soli]AYB34677.1 hypothetical protein D4L85_30640 [Chryseolinea soli]